MDGPDPSELIDLTVAETGLEDLGPATFREGLDVLCTSIGAEAQLNELGGFAVRDTLVAALRTRLQVTDWVHRHPAVREERIDAPIIVIGMFRAGTTLLGRLLDQDPGNRSLLRWESARPGAPTGARELRAGPRSTRPRSRWTCSSSSTPRCVRSTTRTRTGRPSASR